MRSKRISNLKSGAIVIKAAEGRSRKLEANTGGGSLRTTPSAEDRRLAAALRSVKRAAR